MLISILLLLAPTHAHAEPNCSQKLQAQVQNKIAFASVVKDYPATVLGRDPSQDLLKQLHDEFPVKPAEGVVRFIKGPSVRTTHLDNHQIQYEATLVLHEFSSTQLCKDIYACLVHAKEKKRYSEHALSEDEQIALIELIKPEGFLNCPSESAEF